MKVARPSIRLKLTRLLLCVVYFYPATSLIIITLGLLFHIPFGFPAIILSLLASFAMCGVLPNILTKQSTNKNPLFWLGLALVGYIYSIYSPVMEIRQDPSIYALRAYALVNTGTDSIQSTELEAYIEAGLISYQDISGYGKLANGTQWREQRWTPDFYAGSSHLMASLGKFHRMLTYYAATWIAIVCFLLLIRLFSEYCSAKISILLSFTFMLSPLMTWFGRANYSEPIALYCFLSALILLHGLFRSSNLDKKTIFGLIVIIVAACFSRIDMFFLGLAATIALSFRSWKYGLCLAITVFTSYVICSNAFPIYHTRITKVSSVIGSLHFITLIAALCAGFLAHFQSKRVIAIYNSKFSAVILGAMMSIPTILIFRDNLPIDFEIKMMHGREMRTYNELNLERLFFFYPQILIALGSLGLWLKLRETKEPVEYKFFLIICCILFGFYLFNISNSPQMYWAYRRYLYVLIPLFFIGFSYFLKRYEYRQLSIIIVATLLIFTLNLQINSKQIFRSGKPKSEMQGIDVSVNHILDTHTDLIPGSILFHDPKLRYEVSSMISMGSLIPVPTTAIADLQTFINTGKKVFYVGAERRHDLIAKIKNVTEEHIKYVRLGENYLEIPKDLQKKHYRLHLYQFN